MSRLTDHLMFLVVLLSMTVPRSGTKIGGVPITLPIVLYSVLLALWVLRPTSSFRARLRSGDAHADLGTYAAVAFIVVGLASFATGLIGSAETSDILVEGIALVGFVPMFFLVKAHVRSRQTFAAMILLITVSLTIACVYGVCQRIFGHYAVMIPGVTVSYADAMNPDTFALKMNLTAVGLKVVSTFQNGNLFGNYLALLIPIPAALFYASRGSRKLPYLAILILAVACLLLSLSRSAIAAGIMSLGVLSLLLRRATALRVTSVLLLIVGGLLIYILQLGERLLVIDPTLAGRVPTYHNMAAVYEGLFPLGFIKAAVIGVGMGGFVRAAGNSVPIVDSSLFAVGIKMGLLGLLSLLIVIYAAFRFAWRWCRPSATFEGYVGCALAAGILGASVQLAIDGVMMLPPTAMNFWAITGLVFVAGSLVREQSRQGDSRGQG